MTSTYDLDLHFNSAVNLKTGFVFKMGDKGMTFNLHIKDLDPLGMTGKIVFHRSNNTSVESALVGSGSEYTYTILGNEFAVPGVVICDVKFYDEPSQRISTTSFVIGVISDTLDGLGSGTAGYSDELEVLRLAMEQAEQDLQDMSDEFADTLQDYKDAFGNTAPINPKGVYDPNEEYNPRDAVEYTSGTKTLTYICKETCTGELPTNTYYWQVMIDVAVGGSLAALSDVDIPTPADGEVLAYNSTTQKWENEALPTPVDNLTSTSTTSPLAAKQGKVLNDQSSAVTNVYGAKNLNVYPYVDTTQTINGVTFTDNGDGSITVSGVASNDTNFFCRNRITAPVYLKNGTYKLTGCPSGGGSSSYEVDLIYQNSGGSIIYLIDVGNGVEFTVNGSYGDANGANFGVVITIYNGTDLTTPKTFYPMLRDARISDSTFVRGAKTNLQLTADKAERADLSTIHATGATNTTGTPINAGTFFYLNGQLCKVLQYIDNGATFTLNTNFKVDSVGEELKSLYPTIIGDCQGSDTTLNNLIQNYCSSLPLGLYFAAVQDNIGTSVLGGGNKALLILKLDYDYYPIMAYGYASTPTNVTIYKGSFHSGTFKGFVVISP